jgi:hypothetical protein
MLKAIGLTRSEGMGTFGLNVLAIAVLASGSLWYQDPKRKIGM